MFCITAPHRAPSPVRTLPCPEVQRCGVFILLGGLRVASWFGLIFGVFIGLVIVSYTG